MTVKLLDVYLHIHEDCRETQLGLLLQIVGKLIYLAPFSAECKTSGSF
jgi:hypothetical protein